MKVDDRRSVSEPLVSPLVSYPLSVGSSPLPTVGFGSLPEGKGSKGNERRVNDMRNDGSYQ